MNRVLEFILRMRDEASAKIQAVKAAKSVKAADLASVGYGMGYVWAEDHGCTMSGRWLTTGAEVARRFGKDGPGFTFDNRNGNLASDLYIQKLIDERGEG